MGSMKAISHLIQVGELQLNHYPTKTHCEDIQSAELLCQQKSMHN